MGARVVQVSVAGSYSSFAVEALGLFVVESASPPMTKILPVSVTAVATFRRAVIMLARARHPPTVGGPAVPWAPVPPAPVEPALALPPTPLPTALPLAGLATPPAVPEVTGALAVPGCGLLEPEPPCPWQPHARATARPPKRTLRIIIMVSPPRRGA